MGVNTVQFAMMEEGMNFIGTVTIHGNVPCVKCGFGDECKMTGVTMLYGPDATVNTVIIKSFEEQPVAVDAAGELGRKIAEALKSN